jgi:hypothetical protein
MKLQSFSTALGLTAFTLILGASPSFSQGNASAKQPDKVTFLCKSIYDNASGERIPATVAWVPERKVHVRFIAWKSEYFPQFSPQKRCQLVSEKFQKFFESGSLNYLTTGIIRGLPVVCAAKINGDCYPNNQLFTLKFGSDPQTILKRLVNIADGTSGEPIFQSSGGKTYVNVGNFLKNAPVVNVGE